MISWRRTWLRFLKVTANSVRRMSASGLSRHDIVELGCPLFPRKRWARSGHCKLLHTHSGTGPEFNDGDECNQNKDRQYHGLRDRERRFRLCRSQRIEG